MGGATRFMSLLITSFPPLRPSLVLLRRRISTIPLRPITISSPSKIKSRTLKFVNSFHSQSNNNNNNSNSYTLQSTASQQQQLHHPWPEWNNFLNSLSNASENNIIHPDDAFVVYEELPEHFVRVAASCLAFARARPHLLGLLSRRDIEAVVSNGTPFLFKTALNAAGSMRAFLGTDGSSVLGFDKGNTVDLMKYILSYASNATVSSERNRLYSRELVDSSVRNLLHELVTVSSAAPVGHMPAPDHQFSGRQRQPPRPLGQNVEMKRGDWICSKCNFMNFAKNMKCLECEEPRPKKQLTGGEWDCPQCNFYNYGRNTICLRCDCRRPGTPLFNTTNTNSGSGYNGNYINTAEQAVGTNISPSFSQLGSSDFQYSQGSNSNHTPFVPLSAEAFSRGDKISEINNGNKLSEVHYSSENFQIDQNKEKEEAVKSENWFKKIAELHDVKDLPSAVLDEDFPEIMPMRKGDNRFVVSKKKDRSLTSPKYKRQAAMDQNDNTNFVPFVPFPPGYFSKKDTGQSNCSNSPVKPVSNTLPSYPIPNTGSLEDSRNGMSDFSTEPSRSPVQISTASHNVNNNTSTERLLGNESGSQVVTGGDSSQNEDVRSSWTGKSLEGSAVKETDPLDMSEEAKAERWFKRVAQIKDISELSEIPDEDFPSLMPMRKGVNRFVVSKRKTPLERRLTSQQYRRNLPIVINDHVKKESDNS